MNDNKPEHVNSAADAQSLLNVGLGSSFQQAVHHAYAQTDGTYAWPNSREGDMLRQATHEIESMGQKIAQLQSVSQGLIDMLRTKL